MITLYQKDNLRLLVGKVAQEPRFTDRDGSRVATVRIEDRNGDKVDIYFKNDPSAGKYLADRVEKAKISADKWLSVLVAMKDDNSATATGIEFKYAGVWTFKGDENKETNIMVGYSIRPERSREDIFKVSMAADIYNGGKTETRWYGISFFDDEKTLFSKIAEKALSIEGRKSVPCAIRCSKLKTSEKDGRTYFNLVGYRVEPMYSQQAG